MVKKAVNIKAKTSLQFISYIYEIEQLYLWDNCLAYITTTKIQI